MKKPTLKQITDVLVRQGQRQMEVAAALDQLMDKYAAAERDGAGQMADALYRFINGATEEEAFEALNAPVGKVNPLDYANDA